MVSFLLSKFKQENKKNFSKYFTLLLQVKQHKHKNIDGSNWIHLSALADTKWQKVSSAPNVIVVMISSLVATCLG